MKTKFSLVLLAAAIALLVAACAPGNPIVSVPEPASLAQIVPQKDASILQPTPTATVFVPVTGAGIAPREAVRPSLWSGEIFLSDSDVPDVEVNVKLNAGHKAPRECLLEDGQPRRYGGCIE
jgi:hypothetical protein